MPFIYKELRHYIIFLLKEYEGLEPGTYNIIIEGTDKFKDWQWSKDSVTVKAGDSPLYEIDLSK